MKSICIFFFLSFSLIASAQDSTMDIKVRKPNEINTETKIFTVVEQMPQFPGGEDSLMKFIARNITLPDRTGDLDISGRVVVGFIVNEDGHISDVMIRKSLYFI